MTSADSRLPLAYERWPVCQTSAWEKILSQMYYLLVLRDAGHAEGSGHDSG